MPGYYVYIIGDDGHIRDRHSIVCDNDDCAKEKAKQLDDGRAVELWHEARRVASFEPEKK